MSSTPPAPGLVPLRKHHSYKPRKEFHNACATCATVQTNTQCALACCRMFLVALSAEDRAAGLAPLAPFVDLLDKQANGSCAALDETTQLCSNWDERPLECRTYDCREDARNVTSGLQVQQQEFVRWPLPDVDTACFDCERPLELLGGCRADVDGHALCAHCYAPYQFSFDYRDAVFSIRPAPSVDVDTRARYSLTAMVYQERFDDAAAEVATRAATRPLTPFELRSLATVAVERAAFADARQALDGLDAIGEQTVLDRAVLALRAEAFADAAEELDRNGASLPFQGQALAHYYSGRAYRLMGRSVDATNAFSLGTLAAQASGASLTVFKEQLFEMEAEGGEAAEAATTALDQLELLVPTLRT